MPSFLVVYWTGRGQTARIAERVRGVLVDRGHDVTTVRAGAAAPDVEAFDAVVVGSSVNNQRHWPGVAAFVEENREARSSRPTAFFRVSIASALPYGWAKSGARQLADGFFEDVDWRPDRLGLFARAAHYPRYDLFTRLAFKLMAMVTTGDTDTSRRYEYTDWETVDRFAAGFAQHVEETVVGGSRFARLVRRVAG